MIFLLRNQVNQLLRGTAYYLPFFNVSFDDVEDFEKSLCGPLRLFAYFAVKKPLKQLTAKSAKNAKITQRLELRTLPFFHLALNSCPAMA